MTVCLNIEQDVLMSEQIIEQYFHSEDESIPLYAVVHDGELVIHTEGPPWLDALQRAFVERYGPAEAHANMQKALSALIRQRQTVH